MKRKQFLGLMAGAAALAVCAPLSAKPSTNGKVVTLAIGGMS